MATCCKNCVLLQPKKLGFWYNLNEISSTWTLKSNGGDCIGSFTSHKSLRLTSLPCHIEAHWPAWFPSQSYSLSQVLSSHHGLINGVTSLSNSIIAPDGEISLLQTFVGVTFTLISSVNPLGISSTRKYSNANPYIHVADPIQVFPGGPQVGAPSGLRYWNSKLWTPEFCGIIVGVTISPVALVTMYWYIWLAIPHPSLIRKSISLGPSSIPIVPVAGTPILNPLVNTSPRSWCTYLNLTRYCLPWSRYWFNVNLPLLQLVVYCLYCPFSTPETTIAVLQSFIPPIIFPR